MFSSTLVIGVAFIPLFTLTGVAGVIFSPMAHTYAFAIGGAILFGPDADPRTGRARACPSPAVGRRRNEPDNLLMRGLKHLYLPLFAFSLRRKRPPSPLALSSWHRFWGFPARSVASSCPSSRRATSGFAPLCRCRSRLSSRRSTWAACADHSGCPAEATGRGTRRRCRRRNESQALPPGPVIQCDMEHRKHPEVTSVVSQLGRPDDGTDVSGFYNIELFAPLRPQSEWRRGVTKDSMTADCRGSFKRRFRA